MIKRQRRGSSATSPDKHKAEPGSRIDPLSEEIGRGLRALFDDVMAEPVPEKFRDLLDELEQKSGEKA
jgi:hypothetical protein